MTSQWQLLDQLIEEISSNKLKKKNYTLPRSVTQCPSSKNRATVSKNTGILIL